MTDRAAPSGSAEPVADRPAARAFAAYLTEQAKSPLANAATRRDLAVHAAFWRHVAERGG